MGKSSESKMASLIEFYSKKFNLDINYFLKAGLSINIRILADMLGSFFLIFFLTRNFNEIEVGTYYLIIALFGILSIFTFHGFNVAATNSFIKKYFSSYRRTLKVRLYGVVGATLILLAGSIYARIYEPALVSYILLLACMTPVYILKLFNLYLYAKDEFTALTKIMVVESIFYYGTPIILILMKVDLFFVILAFLGMQFLYNLIFAIYYLNKIDKTENTKKIDKKLIPQGFKFSIISVFSLTAIHLDKILLPLFLGLHDLAIYAIAMVVPLNLYGIIEKISKTLFFKKTKDLKISELKKKIKEKGPYITASLILLCLAVWFLIPIFYTLLFPAYLDSIKYAQILSLFLFFITFLEFIKCYFESNNHPFAYLKLETVGYSFQIVAYILLIPLFGIWGAVTARILSILMRFTYVTSKIFSKNAPT